MSEVASTRRRSRRTLLPGLVILGALCLLPVLRGIILPPIILTNRASGLDSLEAVLADGEVSKRLEELAACLPLWRIAGEPIDAGRGGHTHHFDFAEPLLATHGVRLHSRVYRLSASTEGEAPPLVTGWREAYGTAPEALYRPVASRPLGLRMLRLALSDAGVRADIDAAFLAGGETRRLFEVTVVPSSSLGLEPTEPELDLVVGFHFDATEGDVAASSRYWRGRYDATSETANFERLPR